MISQRITCDGPEEPDLLIVVGEHNDPMGYAMSQQARRWLYGMGMPDGIVAFEITASPEAFFRKVPSHLNIIIHDVEKNEHNVIGPTNVLANNCSGGLARDTRLC